MIVKMIQEPNRGILNIINDITDGSDEDILAQTDKSCVVNPHYRSNATGDQSLQRYEFMIKHYDIEVVYSTQGFVAKNKDILSMVCY